MRLLPVKRMCARSSESSAVAKEAQSAKQTDILANYAFSVPAKPEFNYIVHDIAKQILRDDARRGIQRLLEARSAYYRPRAHNRRFEHRAA